MYTAAALHPTKNEPQQALVKTDAQTGQSWLWCKHERYYAGEPAFVPRQRLVKQAGAIPYEQQVEKDSPQNQHDLTSQLCGHLVPEQQQGHQLIQKQHQASSRRAQQQVGRNHPMQTQHKTQPQDTVVSAAGDEGWIVALCYDAAVHCSEFVILDAQKIESGPVAVLPLKKTIPHGLHGIWSEAYVGPSV